MVIIFVRKKSPQPANNSVESVPLRRPTVVIIFLLVFAHSFTFIHGKEWCYEGACGPKFWEGMCKVGKKQSPINIPMSQAKVRVQATRLIVNKNYIVPKPFFLRNDGHTVQVRFNKDGSSNSFIFGDGLGKTPYYFSQLHFHWGPNDRVGSEHRLSGKSYPLEMHLVHKTKTGSKLAVLAVMFYISPRDNPNLNLIVRNLKFVMNPRTTAELGPKLKLALTRLFPKRMRMFRYIGSLTTPPCTENVVWTVFQDPVPVSKRQLAAFRKLIGSNKRPMKKTFRPVQPAFTPARKNIYFLRIFRGSSRRARMVSEYNDEANEVNS